MNTIIGVKNPYGLVQKAGKRKTRAKKTTSHKKTRRKYRK